MNNLPYGIIPLPNLEELKKVIRYEPETGLFYWLSDRKFTGYKAGSVASKRSTKGYNVIQIREFGRTFRCARLAWLFGTGEDPLALEIDHLDRNGLNDRLVNLKPKTHSANIVNTKISTRCKSGIRGVWEKSDGKWGAKIAREGVVRTLGQAYRSKEEAALAYQEAAQAHERGEW